MKVIDSSGWIEFFSDGLLADIYSKHLENPSRVIVPAITLYEVYKKIRSEKGEALALAASHAMSRCRFAPLTDDIAMASADTSIQYKLAMADAIIYTTAQFFKAELITSDADLRNLPQVTYLKK